MIPDFLQPFEKEIIKYRREYLKIVAEPVEVDLDLNEINIFTSSFLGYPFFPKSLPYPMDSKNEPMILAAQINFTELPNLLPLPKKGILQLFLSSTEWYDEEYKVIYHPPDQLRQAYIKDFYFLKPKHYEQSPIQKPHTLSFEKAIDNGNIDDPQFTLSFGKESFLDFEEKLTDKQNKMLWDFFNSDGHKLGGYASFTQSAPAYLETDPYFHLLQIDMDEHIMFGDAGIAHLFIDEKSLAEQNFEKAEFYWDCC